MPGLLGPPDPVTEIALEVLGCLEETLSRYEAEVCRSFLAPGGPPPYDTCCDCGTGEGMAYVQIASVAPTDDFPNQQTGAMRCPPSGQILQLNIAILRCAAVVDDQGRAPSSERMTADALKVQRDRTIVYEAIRCCYLDDADPGTYVIGAFTPLGPIGGCVGGLTTLTLAAPVCRCPDPVD